MTQPVQEPSQGRTDQGQEYRTRQLYRRPSPSGASPTAWARVWRTTNFSIPDNAATDVEFVSFETNSTDAFCTSDSGSFGTCNDQTGDTYVICKQPGIYYATAVIDFSSGFGSNFARYAYIQDLASSNEKFAHSAWPGNDFSLVFAPSGTSSYRMMDFEAIVVDDGTDLSQGFGISCYQNSGVSKNVNPVYLFVLYYPTTVAGAVIY